MGIDHKTAWKAAELIETQAAEIERLQTALSQARAEGAEAMKWECATFAAIHSQYPITTDYDRGYAQARKDAAAAIRALPTQEQNNGL